MKFLFVIIFVCSLSNSFSQTKYQKPYRKVLSDFEFIQGGVFTKGNHAEISMWRKYSSQDSTLLPVLGVKQDSVTDFLMNNHEVTNKEWQVFYQDILLKEGKEKANELLPDTTVWADFDDYMREFYFSHHALNEYPVIGINWIQANKYCQWYTQKVAKDLGVLQETVPQFRLPTESEWEYAAIAGDDVNYYSWGKDNIFINTKKSGMKVAGNIGETIDQNGVMISKDNDDGFPYTAPVRSFEKNSYGLYNLSGNVAEWVMDTVVHKKIFHNIAKGNKKIESTSIVRKLEQYNRLAGKNKHITKGGSWATGPAYALNASRQVFDSKDKKAFIGFRMVVSITEENKHWLQQKK